MGDGINGIGEINGTNGTYRAAVLEKPLLVFGVCRLYSDAENAERARVTMEDRSGGGEGPAEYIEVPIRKYMYTVLCLG